MTVLINLLGQPSTGKTTTMAHLYARFKSEQADCEICPEWVKTWAWENKKIDEFGEFYIFGKETHQQSRLIDKVDYIISDSPVFLVAFYHEYYNKDKSLMPAVKSFYDMLEKRNVQVYNFFLTKNKPYNPKGRFQPEEEAERIGIEILDWMIYNNIQYDRLDCPDDERIDRILERIGHVRTA